MLYSFSLQEQVLPHSTQHSALSTVVSFSLQEQILLLLPLKSEPIEVG